MHRSATLSQLTGAEVYLKFENLQFTASFKERGALNRLLTLDPDQAARGVIAMSAGNHAQGVARHAGLLGIPSVIVMPEGTPFVKVAHTRAHGARVVLAGETVAEARPVAEEIMHREGLTFVHPYDDPLIMAGQGTIALEMLEDQPDLNCLIAPIGGGGLLSGIALAAKALKPTIDLVGVQTALYPAMLKAIEADRQGLPIPDATGLAIRGGATIAEGIAVKEPGRLTLPVIRDLVSKIILVDEVSLESAINLLITVEKTVAEGAGAAGLAALLSEPEQFRGKSVGLVLCGGNIDPRLLANVLMRALVRQGQVVAYAISVGDAPGQLSKVAALIAETGANVIDIQHQRLLSDLSIKATDLDVTLEVRDSDHAAEIETKLETAGFRARRRQFLREA